MNRQFVESSVIAAVGYDHGTMMLEVEFKNGGIYRYENVPYSVAEALFTARSVGQFFSSRVRDRFRSRKVN